MEKFPSSGSTDKLQARVYQLRASFIDQMPGRLAKLEGLLLPIKKENSIAEENFRELCSIVHTLKGTSSAYGLHTLATVCHQFEDLLQAISGVLSNLPQQFVDQSFAYNGLLKQVVDQARSGNEAFPEIEQALLDLRKKYSAESAP